MLSNLVLFLFVAYVPFSRIAQSTKNPCFPDNIYYQDRNWTHPYNNDNGPILHNILEGAINKLINSELSAHYAYLSMAYYFDQDDYYLPGFSRFFKKMAEKEYERVQELMKYQNKRGGRILLNAIPKPCDDGNWGNGTMAMKKALHMESHLNFKWLQLHQIGSHDPQFLHVLESEFLGEQVESIKEISNYVHILQRLDSHSGEYQFDKWTLVGCKKE